jgi:GNAT superfamily N-acetyltransferase
MSSGLTARAATAADYEHFVRLVPELATGDPIPGPEVWARILVPDTLIFEEGGEVVAYAYVQVLQGVGYVRHVVIDRSRRGRGLGRAVMETIAARLRGAGCARWCLNVKPDNEPAIRLYRGVGMQEAYTSTALRLGWDVVERLPRGGRAVIARPVEPGEDPAIEGAFGLPDGQIAAARARGGLVLLRLVDPAALGDPRVGFASFDPIFGAFPFRVADPALAAPLLDAIRPHARPDPPYTQLMIEDDEVLTRALLEAGATVRLRAVHLRGAVPSIK